MPHKLTLGQAVEYIAAHGFYAPPGIRRIKNGGSVNGDRKLKESTPRLTAGALQGNGRLCGEIRDQLNLIIREGLEAATVSSTAVRWSS
jgi:hypothetical protein